LARLQAAPLAPCRLDPEILREFVLAQVPLLRILLASLANLDRAIAALLPEHPKTAVLAPLPRIGQNESPWRLHSLGGWSPMSSSKQPSQHPSGRRYPPELKERAVRMVREAITESGERFGVITRVARQLGVGAETLRLWVNQAEVDAGQRPGMSTDEGRRIAELERENRELRRANEILKAASVFFALMP
jgi:transposase